MTKDQFYERLKRISQLDKEIEKSLDKHGIPTTILITSMETRNYASNTTSGNNKTDRKGFGC